MRDLPESIHRVAAESAAYMVEKPSVRHARECQRRHQKRIQIGFVIVGAAAPVPQQSFDCGRMRKLGSRAETAEFTVKCLCERFASLSQRLVIEAGVSSGRSGVQPLEDGQQLGALILNVAAFVRVIRRDILQQIAERRHAIAGFFREISAAKKWSLILGVEKHRQGPATTALR